MSDINSTNALVPNCTTHYHAPLGLSDKGLAIKGLVVCYAVWLGSMIYGMGLCTSARSVGLVPCCGQDGYRAQEPQHPIDTYRYIYFVVVNFIRLALPLKGVQNQNRRLTSNNAHTHTYTYTRAHTRTHMGATE